MGCGGGRVCRAVQQPVCRELTEGDWTRAAGGTGGPFARWGFSPCAVGTAGNGALPGGALFLWRNRGKNTKGKEVPSPWNPILWWEEWGKVVPSGRGLACGLQDQRLMARPPARAGGRSGLLTGGESGKPKRLLSAFSQRVSIHVPSPPSRWAGRYGPFNVRAAGQVPRKKYSLPHTTPPEKGVPGEEPPPPGVLSPISSQEMGPRPGRPRFPAVPTA